MLAKRAAASLAIALRQMASSRASTPGRNSRTAGTGAALPSGLVPVGLNEQATTPVPAQPTTPATNPPAPVGLDGPPPGLVTGSNVIVSGRASDALAGVAVMPDRDTAWVSEQALREWSGRADNTAWQDALTAMIQKAKPHGWIDEASKSIKAHVEWPT